MRRSSVAKSSMVAMCCPTRTWWQCVAPQEGGQSLGNPADTRRGKKRLTRMLIGNKNHGKYLTPILFKFCCHPIHNCQSLIQPPRLKPLASRFLFCCSKSQSQTEVSEDQGKFNCGASFRIISFEALCSTCLIIVINDGFLRQKIH